MRLELADVFNITAGNSSASDMVRAWRHPAVEELGEAYDKYVVQNS